VGSSDTSDAQYPRRAKIVFANLVDKLDWADHLRRLANQAINVAERYGVAREDHDALALESHRRASNASKAGCFKDQILGIEVKSARARRCSTPTSMCVTTLPLKTSKA
jgi:acetyl-CoA acetyltransferase